MDPNRLTDPDVFNPSRYANDSQTIRRGYYANPDATKRDHFAFGAGRRICRGMHIAERSIFLGISRLVWAFNFKKASDSLEQRNHAGPERCHGRGSDSAITIPGQDYSEIRGTRTPSREAWKDCEQYLDDKKQWKEVPKGMVFTSFDEMEWAQDGF